MAKDIRENRQVEVPEDYTLHLGIVAKNDEEARRVARAIVNSIGWIGPIAPGWSVTGTEGEWLDWAVHVGGEG